MIEEKIKTLQESIKWVGFSTSQPWNAYDVRFYEYFNHEEKHIKAGSLFALFGMLEQWVEGSSYAFGMFDGQVGAVHKLDDYLKALIDNSDEIAKEFPSMYSAIVFLLRKLDDERKFEMRFPKTGEGLFRNMRVTLFTDDVLNRSWTKNYYQDTFIEVGLNKDYM